MATPALRPPPRTAPIDQRTGRLTLDWEMFFRQLYIRVGGADGASSDILNDDMLQDPVSEPLVAQGDQNPVALQPVPAQGDQDPVALPYLPQDILDLSVEELRSLVMVLFVEVNALKQAIQT